MAGLDTLSTTRLHWKTLLDLQGPRPYSRLFEPAWALLEDGLAVTLKDSVLKGYWETYMATPAERQRFLQCQQARCASLCLVAGIGLSRGSHIAKCGVLTATAPTKGYGSTEAVSLMSAAAGADVLGHADEPADELHGRRGGCCWGRPGTAAPAARRPSARTCRCVTQGRVRICAVAYVCAVVFANVLLHALMLLQTLSNPSVTPAGQ